MDHFVGFLKTSHTMMKYLPMAARCFMHYKSTALVKIILLVCLNAN